MSENPTFQIPKDIIEPIIQAHVSAAVVSALGENKKIVEMAISRVLNQKVNSDGNTSGYVYNNSPTFIQWLMSKAVRSAVEKAVVEQVATYQDELKKAIAAELGIGKKYSPLAKGR
jgi:hypothetical protein